jgi:hypothetical protein
LRPPHSNTALTNCTKRRRAGQQYKQSHAPSTRVCQNIFLPLSAGAIVCWLKSLRWNATHKKSRQARRWRLPSNVGQVSGCARGGFWHAALPSDQHPPPDSATTLSLSLSLLSILPFFECVRMYMCVACTLSGRVKFSRKRAKERV